MHIAAPVYVVYVIVLDDRSVRDSERKAALKHFNSDQVEFFFKAAAYDISDITATICTLCRPISLMRTGHPGGKLRLVVMLNFLRSIKSTGQVVSHTIKRCIND